MFGSFFFFCVPLPSSSYHQHPLALLPFKEREGVGEPHSCEASQRQQPTATMTTRWQTPVPLAVVAATLDRSPREEAARCF